VKCSKCGKDNDHILDSRPMNGIVKRVRECYECGHRWKTFEQVEDMPNITKQVDIELQKMEKAIQYNLDIGKVTLAGQIAAKKEGFEQCLSISQ